MSPTRSVAVPEVLRRLARNQREIEDLRALVVELADALEVSHDDGCEHTDDTCPVMPLLARARQAVGP